MIVEALKALRPGAQWILNGDTLDGLVWTDEQQSRPTDNEINAKIAELAAAASRRLVAKSLIVDRLQAVGKLAAARAALDAAALYDRERWNSRDAIYADDPTARALLQAIGADPASILAE